MTIRAGWGLAALAAFVAACSSSQGVDPSGQPLEGHDDGGIPGVGGSAGASGAAGASMQDDAAAAEDGEAGKDAAPPDLSNGLVAWYPLRGDTHDASGNGNDGVNSGATPVQDRFGHENSAYHFDGSVYIEASGTALPVGGTARTITAWVNPDEQGTGEHDGNTFLSWGTGDCVGKMFGMGNYLGMLTNWVGCADFHTQLMLPSGVWSFVAVRFEPPHTITAWVGETSGEKINDYVKTESGKLRIGVESIDDGVTFRHWFKGSLSDVRIYNRPLSDEEIGLLRTGEGGI